MQRQPAQQRRVGAAADHHREPELAREADVLALLAVVDGDDADPAPAQQQAEPQPDLAQPTTTTWSRRGTARRPNSPVSRRSISRLTRPAVNDASNTSAASIETVRNAFSPFGPSATLSLGSTVTSVFAAP